MMAAAIILLSVANLIATCALDNTDDQVEAAVKALEGSVVRDKQKPGQPVISVILSLSKCTDADLKKLAGLKSLSYLCRCTVPRLRTLASMN